MKHEIPVIDYEGSGYQTDFWVGRGREYEDTIERVVLTQLLPKQGKRVAEIGAGFGRLADLYLGYDQIVLFDYSRTLLQEAVAKWGADSRFVFVAGNIYELPFADGAVDTLVMVRVMHHLANVESALTQLRRVLHANSVAVLEYANKRNLKALLRWAVGRQPWSPLEMEPVEFVELNFDFHPAWMNKTLQQAGFGVEEQLAVSHFRLPQLKRLFSAQQLVAVERPLLKVAGKFPLSPSVFVKLYPEGAFDLNTQPKATADVASLFRCPRCNSETLIQQSESCLACSTCSTRYLRENNIWDFKNPQ